MNKVIEIGRLTKDPEWINRTYKILVDNKDIPKMELGLPDGGKISVYRVVDVIRIDIKRPETKRG